SFGQNMVWLGTGAGGFSTSVTLGITSNTTRTVVAGDLDNDGDMDVVVGNAGSGLGEINRVIMNGADADSQLVASSIVIEPATIHSVPGAIAPVAVLDFSIIDSGTGDGQPTTVNAINLAVTGLGDASEHGWTLAGLGIGGSAMGLVSGQVG